MPPTSLRSGARGTFLGGCCSSPSWGRSVWMICYRPPPTSIGALPIPDESEDRMSDIRYAANLTPMPQTPRPERQAQEARSPGWTAPDRAVQGRRP
jgi:hypothetical protein